METTDEFKYAIESIKEYYEKNNKFVEGKMPNPQYWHKSWWTVKFEVDKLKKMEKRCGIQGEVKQATNDLYDELNFEITYGRN